MRSFLATALPRPLEKGPSRVCLLFGGLSLLLGACHSPPKSQFPTVRTALTQLQDQTSCSRGVQGDARLTVSAPLMADLSGELLFKAQAPSKIRFDLYSSFGVTLNTLTSDGRSFAHYDLPNRSFWYGPPKTCNLASFTRVQVPPLALVELLRGRPPIVAHQQSAATIEFSSPLFSRGRYVVNVRGDNQVEQTLEIEVAKQDYKKPLEQQRLRLRKVRVEQAGELLYEVELDRYKKASRAPNELTEEELMMGVAPLAPSGPECAAELPRRVVFSVPGTGAELTIESHEMMHNPPILPGSFTQEIPGGVTSSFADCTE